MDQEEENDINMIDIAEENNKPHKLKNRFLKKKLKKQMQKDKQLKKQGKQGEGIENEEEQEQLNYIQKKKQALLANLNEYRQLDKSQFTMALTKLFREHNKDQMNKISEGFEIEDLYMFAEQAIIVNLDGFSQKDEGKSRTLGGSYFKIVKEYLEKEDDMKLKQIFCRSEDYKRKRNQNTQRRKQGKKTAISNNVNSNAKSGNIFEALM